MERAADFLGDIHREEEVPSADGQRMDLWFLRREVTEALPEFMELLDRMLRHNAMIDLFSQTLAVTSPGRPERVLREYSFAEDRSLSPGVYLSGSGFPIGIVVISELPVGQQRTLLFRLMGDAAVQAQATQELLALPETAAGRRVLLGLLAALRPSMKRANNRESRPTTEDEPMSEIWAEIERYEKSLMDKGAEKGLEKGLARSILTVLSARHLEVSEGVRERILTATDPDQLDRWLARAATVATAEDVFARN